MAGKSLAFNLEYSCRICLDNNALLNIYLTKRSHNSAKVACDEMMIAVFCIKVGSVALNRPI